MMGRRFIVVVLLAAGILLAATTALVGCDAATDEPGTSAPAPSMPDPSGGATFALPEPRKDGPVSLEKAIDQRRSIRDYSDEPLSLVDVAQLLWAAQGVTSPSGARAAPSAGGTYPLELYVVAGRVTGLEPGVYHYRPSSHDLTRVADGDFRASLADAALGQESVRNGAMDVVVAADYARTTERYGDRGVRFVHLEAGHAAQNLCLQATALGLGAVTVGAFTDEDVKKVLQLPAALEPLYVIPVGHPAAG